MEEEILSYVKNLQDDITRAWLSFQIHRFYTDSRTRPLYLSTMNMYVGFFATSIHAHFTTMIIELYRIHENRKDTYNLPKLISMVKSHRNFPKKTLSIVESLCGEIKPLWGKVAILRNNCFGHVSNTLDPSVYYKKASVAPKDIQYLIKLSRQCLNEIQYALKKSRVADIRFGKSYIENMMKDLKEYYELRQMSPTKRSELDGFII